MKSDFKSSFIEGKTGMCLERDDLMIIIVVVIPHIIQQESRLKIPQCTMIMQFPDFSQSFFFTFTSSTFLLYSGRRG